MAEDYLKTSPLVGLQKPHAQNSRDRILTDDELRNVWKAADATGYAFGDFVKVAILTGQRPGEVSGMRRDELRGDTWILPSERVKNKKSTQSRCRDRPWRSSERAAHKRRNSFLVTAAANTRSTSRQASPRQGVERHRLDTSRFAKNLRKRARQAWRQHCGNRADTESPRRLAGRRNRCLHQTPI